MSSISIGSRFKGRARNLSSDGRAVVEDFHSQFVYFVEGAWPGDEGLFEVLSLEKRYGFAKIVELRTLSADRVSPRCGYQGVGSGRCGGCSWMIGNYESQLRAKTHRLEHALKRAGIISQENFSALKTPIGSDQIFAYRNRVQVKSDGKKMGFLSLGSTELVDVAECAVMNDELKILYKALRTRMGDQALKPAKTHKYVFVDLDDEVAITDISTLPVNRRRPFKQGNTSQNEKMKAWVKERVSRFCKSLETSRLSGASPKQRVSILELYAGSGNFTKVLLEEKNVEKVVAVEVVDEAISKMAETLQVKMATKLKTVKHSLGSLKDFEKFSKKISDETFDCLLLDPPREGAEGIELLIERMNPRPKNIFYISCDVATFTRDVTRLNKKGYQVSEITPIDLFPHTPHVEILGVLAWNG